MTSNLLYNLLYYIIAISLVSKFELFQVENLYVEIY